MGEDVHETITRVLEEESQGHDVGATVERMRQHVAYVDKLRADRLYLARCMHNCMEASARNSDYYKGQVAKLEKQVATLKEQLADAELGKDR